MTMRKIYFTLIALLLCISQSNAQLLWKISGNGLEKPSYIFGTHHVAPLSIIDSIPAFNKAFEDCSVVYGEIIINKDSLQQMAMKYGQLMLSPADSTLDKVLSKEYYEKLDKIVSNSMGIRADQIKTLKPNALATQMALITHMKVFKNHNPNEQLDMTMQKRGKDAGKRLAAFETSEQQFNLLFGTPISEQVSALTTLIDHNDRMEEYVIAMNDAYMTQDIAKLLTLMMDEETGSDIKGLERIIFERNRNWCKQLKEILPKQEPIFIVVGAGHLPGEEGLIELLKKQGYTVEAAS